VIAHSLLDRLIPRTERRAEFPRITYAAKISNRHTDSSDHIPMEFTVNQISTIEFEARDGNMERLLISAPEVSAKLEQLAHLRDTEYAKLKAAKDRESEAKDTVRIAERDLEDLREHDRRNRARLEKHSPDGSIVHERDTKQIEEANARVQAARTRLESAHALAKRASADWQKLAGLDHSVCRYLQQFSSETKLIAEEPSPAKLRKGESFSDAVVRLRGALDDIYRDVIETKSAPIPPEKAKQIAANYVSKLAAEGRPDISMFLQRGGGLRWSNQQVPGLNVDGLIPQFAKALPVIAWMHEGALVEAIHREIDSAAKSELSLNDEDRSLRLIELANAQLKLEREEEGFICQAAEAGIEIARRKNADPRAVLGLSSEMPAPKK
jgi:hypothetical protein